MVRNLLVLVNRKNISNMVYEGNKVLLFLQHHKLLLNSIFFRDELDSLGNNIFAGIHHIYAVGIVKDGISA